MSPGLVALSERTERRSCCDSCSTVRGSSPCTGGAFASSTKMTPTVSSCRGFQCRYGIAIEKACDVSAREVKRGVERGRREGGQARQEGGEVKRGREVKQGREGRGAGECGEPCKTRAEGVAACCAIAYGEDGRRAARAGWALLHEVGVEGRVGLAVVGVVGGAGTRRARGGRGSGRLALQDGAQRLEQAGLLGGEVHVGRVVARLRRQRAQRARKPVRGHLVRRPRRPSQGPHQRPRHERQQHHERQRRRANRHFQAGIVE